MTNDLHAEALALNLKGLVLPNGLRIESLQIEGEAVDVQFDPFEWNIVKPGKATALCLASDLTKMMTEKLPAQIEHVEAEFFDGYVQIFAKARMIVQISVDIEATLKIVDGKSLHIDLLKVDVGGMGAKSLVEDKINEANPILDASQLPIDITLDEVILDPGGITLYGTVKPGSGHVDP